MLEITDSMRNGKIYDGTTLKFGVTIADKDYIVKLGTADLSVYSEHIASSIIRYKLHIPCHKTELGTYKGNPVCVLQDFTTPTAALHTFKDTKQSSEDTDLADKEYTYQDVLYLIDKHLKLDEQTKKKAKEQFWDMYIADAILGNRDRHWGNWGFLTNGKTYTPAPLFDNGASLFPGVLSVISEFQDNTARYAFLKQRVEVFPASLLCIRRPDRCYRTNYKEIFSDLRKFPLLAERVREIQRRVGTWQSLGLYVRDLCCACGMSVVLIKFYIEIVCLRYKVIVLREPFDKAYAQVEEFVWGK